LVYAALDRIDAEGPGGSTDYQAAVNLIDAEYDANGVKTRSWVSLFLSDGTPTAPVPPLGTEDPGDDQAALDATQQAADRGIVMDTFGVGQDASDTILQQMADMTGGKYNKISNPGDILTVLPGESLVGIHSLTVT